MPYRLVVFDFDGTLADSLAEMLAVYNRIAPGLGLRTIDDPEAARAVPTRELLRDLGVRFWRLPRVVRAFQAEAARRGWEVRLHAGVADMLAGLRAGGCRLGVLSSNREDAIRACLRAHGVEDAFAFVVGYAKLFGKAKGLRRILKAERIERADVLYVGDELRDVEAARRAKVAVAAVTWGFHAEGLLAAAGATYLVRTPGELTAL